MKKQKLFKVVLAGIIGLLLLITMFFPKNTGLLVADVLLVFVQLCLLLSSFSEKNNSVKVVLSTILMFMLLTWILPAAYYQGSYVEQGRTQMGLFDLFSYPITALSYFGYFAAFILTIGGFYGILGKIGAYRTLLDKLAIIFKKKGKLVISIIMVLIAVLTSVCGLQFALMIFYPFLAALLFLMGYDKIVVALTLVGSSIIGIAGSTYGYDNTRIIISTLGLKISSNMLVKVIILVLGLCLLIFNTIRYIIKMEKGTKKESSKSAEKEVKKKKADDKTKDSKAKKDTKSKKSTKTTVAAEKEEEVKVVKTEKNVNDEFIPAVVRGKHKVWPLVVVFTIMFIVTILAFISWNGAFESSVFEDVTENVTKYEIFKFALFGKLLGNVKAFGGWSLSELITLMILAAGLLMLVYKVKFNDGLDAFAKGAKKALQPALIVILIYTGLVVVTYHPFQLTIYKFLFGFTKGFNVITSSLAAIVASVFNADPLYVFQSVLPYFASLVSKKSTLAIAGVVYQSMYGITMLVAPTSIVLMTVLSYLGITYKEWFKSIWKLLLELIVMLIIVFTILVLV